MTTKEDPQVYAWRVRRGPGRKSKRSLLCLCRTCYVTNNPPQQNVFSPGFPHSAECFNMQPRCNLDPPPHYTHHDPTTFDLAACGSSRRSRGGLRLREVSEIIPFEIRACPPNGSFDDLRTLSTWLIDWSVDTTGHIECTQHDFIRYTPMH